MKLDRYLDRIGITGPLTPDRGSLAKIVAAHPGAIPFENIDPLLGTPVLLDADALASKLLENGRGGFCFEQNLLLKAALEEVGFAVTGHTARVLWNAAPGATGGRTHMLLLVALPGGPVMVDGGFGGNTPTGVLDLVDGEPQNTPHERFQLTRDGDAWVQAIELEGTWRPTYRFTVEPQYQADYEMGSHYMATSQRSHFVYGLTCARALPGKRLTLRNFDYAIHHVGGASERRRLENASAVCDVVEKDFGIRLPDRAALIARIDAGLA